MKNKIALMLVLVAGVFWGSSPLFVSKLSQIGFSSIQSTSIRLTLAIPMLHILLLCKGKENYKISLRSMLLFAVCGLFSVLTMCTCYYYAIVHTSAAVAAVLMYTAPIFVMIMSLFVFKEKLTYKKTICLFLTIIGCALTSGIVGGIKGSVIGVLIGLLSGFAYALYSIFSALALKQKNSPLTCTAFSFTFAAIGIQFFTSPVDIVNTVISADSPFFCILGMILFSACTCVIPFALYTIGLVSLKPDVAAILAATEPVVAAIVGIFILNQAPDIFQIIGIILVIITITVLNIDFKHKKTSVD